MHLRGRASLVVSASLASALAWSYGCTISNTIVVPGTGALQDGSLGDSAPSSSLLDGTLARDNEVPVVDGSATSDGSNVDATFASDSEGPLVDGGATPDGNNVAAEDASKLDAGDVTDATDSAIGIVDSALDAGIDVATDANIGSDAGIDATASGCASPPEIFQPADAGVYCPYSSSGAHCVRGSQICCVTPDEDAGTSVCEVPSSSASPSCAQSGFQLWQCGSPADCAGNANGPVCCLTSGPLEVDITCTGYQKTVGFNSLTCTTATKCAGTTTVPRGAGYDSGTYTDNLYTVCTTASDCPSGMTCEAIFTIGQSLGVCVN